MRKVALVTGSSRGIGRAIALRLAKDGLRVILHGSKLTDQLNKTQEELKKNDSSVIKIYFDLKDVKETEEALDKLTSKVKKIDILVNNAGIIRDKTLLKMSYEEWDEVVKTNLSGAFLVTKKILPLMIDNKFGRIINISSMIGVKGNFGQSNYAASKAGLIGLTKSLAREVYKYNINCNAVCPGLIRTEAIKDIPKTYINELLSSTIAKKPGAPEDVASLVSMLSRDEASYITGSVFEVNGGWL